MTVKALVWWIAAGVCAAASVALVATAKAPGAQCGDGFFPVGHRCCAAVSGDGKACGPARSCPVPLLFENGLCVAADGVVEIPETKIIVGPSDWEADGVVRPRELHVMPFAIDAFEITEGRIHADSAKEDPARAAGGLSRAEVVAFCKERGGRLPTEDEWVVAASGRAATRYPWGDTGAVCRRAAWGLVTGPCAHGAKGPDTVGAHAGGDAPGVHDLAGNVAEWVQSDRGVVLGGSYATTLAAELRVWSRAWVDPQAHDPTVGGRCAYDRAR